MQRVDSALTHLLANISKDTDITDFEEFCGVGVVVSPEEIEEEVEKVIKAHKNEILEKRRVKCFNFLLIRSWRALTRTEIFYAHV